MVCLLFRVPINLLWKALVVLLVSSDDSNLRCFWKKLWWLPAPHKVRHILWRACHDILPTKVNLKRQKVLSEDFCEECLLEPETSGHLFWSCPRAKSVRSCSGIFNPDCAVQFSSVALWS